MRLCKIFLSLGLLCASFVAFGQVPDCRDELTRLIYPTNSLTEQTILYDHRELKHLLAVWESRDLSLEEKINEAFNIYLNARLNILPTPVFERAVAFVENIRFDTADLAYFDIVRGHYDSALGQIHISILGPAGPSRLLLALAITAHELEHAIQHIRTNLSPGPVVPFTRWRRYGPGKDELRQKFLEEKSAMLAEYFFLSSLPSHSLFEPIANAIPPLGHPNHHDFKRLIHTMRLATESVDPRTYLRRQWSQERYSLTQLREARRSHPLLESEGAR